MRIKIQNIDINLYHAPFPRQTGLIQMHIEIQVQLSIVVTRCPLSLTNYQFTMVWLESGCGRHRVTPTRKAGISLHRPISTTVLDQERNANAKLVTANRLSIKKKNRLSILRYNGTLCVV